MSTPSSAHGNVRRPLTLMATGTLWIATLALGMYLTAQRYGDGVSTLPQIGIDLHIFFEAAEHARRGEQVFAADGYVFSPLLAWLLTPFPTFDDVVVPWTIATLAACWAAVAAVTATLWSLLRAWQRPIVAAVGLVTLLSSQLLVRLLWLGQVDTVVIFLAALAVLLTRFGRSPASGAVLVFAALLKTWTAAFGLWLLRRDAPRRWVSIATAAGTAGLALIVFAIVSGPGVLLDWVQRTLELSYQRVVVFSVWGAARHLFSDSGEMDPIVIAPVLGAVFAALLAAAVIGLLILALRYPSSDSLSMWHVVSAVILLLPVSHQTYRLYMLPLVWVWTAYLFSDRRRIHAIVALAGLVPWWFLSHRLPPIESVDVGDPGQYTVFLTTAVVALAVSVLAATDRDRRARRGHGSATASDAAESFPTTRPTPLSPQHRSRR